MCVCAYLEWNSKSYMNTPAPFSVTFPMIFRLEWGIQKEINCFSSFPGHFRHSLDISPLPWTLYAYNSLLYSWRNDNHFQRYFFVGRPIFHKLLYNNFLYRCSLSFPNSSSVENFMRQISSKYFITKFQAGKTCLFPSSCFIQDFLLFSYSISAVGVSFGWNDTRKSRKSKISQGKYFPFLFPRVLFFVLGNIFFVALFPQLSSESNAFCVSNYFKRNTTPLKSKPKAPNFFFFEIRKPLFLFKSAGLSDFLGFILWFSS